MKEALRECCSLASRPTTSPIAKLVHGDRDVFGVPRVTGVEVVVILGEEIHIVKEEAVPFFVPQGLLHPHVQQFGPVESGVPSLRGEKRQGGWAACVEAGLALPCGK